MKSQDNIKTLFIAELKEIFNAEQQIVKALPEMVKAAESSDLKDAFSNHLDETREHIERLEKIFSMLGTDNQGEQCESMELLIKHGSEAIKKFPKSPLRDAALIAGAQRIEHFEIAVYGTLRTFAKELDFDDAADLLKDTLDEEGTADKKLTKIAEGTLMTSGVNRKANER